MLKKANLYFQIFRNMGWKYVLYRVFFALKEKLGVLKTQFPVNPPRKHFFTLQNWKDADVHYFFGSKETLRIPKQKNDTLRQRFLDFNSGKIWFFNSTQYNIGTEYDWLTNPSNGYKYDISRHWSEISDLSTEAGDIKYIWEKSRFSYLHDIIRYDYHFEEDLSELVFSEIESWIAANPINQGPNYKCSQEISLRLLNWIFALHYYKNATALDETLFQKIQHNIYWQLRHVYSNINFSRYTVRNNHAITECLMLYIAGILFPSFPESPIWKKKGKIWFEQEILYQVYEDGTFLQFSHNYHRVLIQLFSVGFQIAALNNEHFSPTIYHRAAKSLDYLYQCMAGRNGELPNYGANDGALFFKWNDANFRDYRPQLNALYYYFSGKNLFPEAGMDQTEDLFWLGLDSTTGFNPGFSLSLNPVCEFRKGGIYTIRDGNTFTFIKCAGYRDRPSQADNLHVDIWVNGLNVLRDAGSYSYNADAELVRYFAGTKGHNTVMLGDHDQMLKGPRFIWLYWSKVLHANITMKKTEFEFLGETEVFRHIKTGILHRRIIKKQKGKAVWTIEDTMKHSSNNNITQRWHYDKSVAANINFSSTAEICITEQAYYSAFYGKMEESTCMAFTSLEDRIITTITVGAE